MLRALPSGLIDHESHGHLRHRDLELVTAWAERRLWAQVEPAWRRILLTFGSCALSGLALAVLFALQGLWAASGASVLAAALGGSFLLRRIRNLKPRCRVRNVRRTYWALAAVPVGTRRALLDLHGDAARREISVERFRQPDRLSALAAELDELARDCEVFEPAHEKLDVDGQVLFGSDSRLTRVLLDVRAALQDRASETVWLPAVRWDGDQASALRSIEPLMGPADVAPVRAPADPAGLAAEVRELVSVEALTRYSGEGSVAALLEELGTAADRALAWVEATHRTSLALVDTTHALALATTGQSVESLYCPFCNTVSEDGPRPISRATRLVRDFELHGGSLACPVCDEPVPDESSLAVSRFKDELFDPLFDKVTHSVRDQVLAIERDVENQVVQLEKDRRLKLGDLRRDIEKERRRRLGEIRQHKARAQALEAQVVGITAILHQYERIEEAARRRFQEDARRIREETERRAREAEQRIRARFEQLQRQADAESARIAELNRVEQQQRHREQMEVMARQAQAAERSAAAQEKQLTYTLMNGEERQDAQHAGWTDSINLVKQYRRGRARRRSGRTSENL